MKNSTDRTKVVAFLVGGAVLFAVTLFVFIAPGALEDYVTYTLYVDDVDGLEEGARVALRGVDVGEVEEILLFPEERPTKVRVVLTVEEDRPLPKGVIAILQHEGVGVSGRRYVQLGGGDPRDGYVEPNSELDVRPDMMAQLRIRFEKFSEKAATLMTDTSSLVASLNDVVQEVSPKRIDELLTNANHAVERIDVAAGQAALLMSENRKTVRHALDNVSEASNQFGTVAARTTETAREAEALMKDLRRVVGDNDDRITATLDHLQSASEELETFGRRIRNNPSQLLRSSAPEPRRLP